MITHNCFTRSENVSFNSYHKALDLRWKNTFYNIKEYFRMFFFKQLLYSNSNNLHKQVNSSKCLPLNTCYCNVRDYRNYLTSKSAYKHSFIMYDITEKVCKWKRLVLHFWSWNSVAAHGPFVRAGLSGASAHKRKCLWSYSNRRIKSAV